MFQFAPKSHLADLRGNSVVMIEIIADLWAGLIRRIEDCMGCTIPTASVFMTAVPPGAIGS